MVADADLLPIALLSMVCACVSFTIAETLVFRRFREMVAGRSAWLGKLVSCGYCLGCWIALGLVIVCRPRAFAVHPVLDAALTAAVIAWLSAFQWLALGLMMQKAGK